MAKDIDYDAIVVLGAQVRPEGVPSEALRRRLSVALERYQARPVPIICCGAQGSNEPLPEGDVMCRWLVERGVAAEHAIGENQSYDTLQNIRNAKRIMAARGLNGILLVTSDYHLRRALAICRRYGIPAIGAASQTAPEYWLKMNVREALAWVKFCLWGILDRWRG